MGKQGYINFTENNKPVSDWWQTFVSKSCFNLSSADNEKDLYFLSGRGSYIYNSHWYKIAKREESSRSLERIVVLLLFYPYHSISVPGSLKVRFVFPQFLEASWLNQKWENENKS